MVSSSELLLQSSWAESDENQINDVRKCDRHLKCLKTISFTSRYSRKRSIFG